MKAVQFSLIHGLILAVFGVWGYLASDNPSITALIPTILGALILSTNYGMRLGKRGFKIAALVLTGIILLGLLKPLGGVLGRQDIMGIFRVSSMIVVSIIAFFLLIKDLFGNRNPSAD